jgi:hypothetical protein
VEITAMTVSEPDPVGTPADLGVDPGDLLDALDDLAHDLGRHIRLPLALLPIDAPETEVAAAAERAVRRTRTGPRGVFGADELLTDFLAGVPAPLRPACAPLEAAVATAVALVETRPLPERARLKAAFDAVGTEIGILAARWRPSATQ